MNACNDELTFVYFCIIIIVASAIALDPPSNTHQSLMRLLPNSREPCCVPSEYESLVLALSLNSQHSLHYIEDAVVKSCECL